MTDYLSRDDSGAMSWTIAPVPPVIPPPVDLTPINNQLAALTTRVTAAEAAIAALQPKPPTPVTEFSDFAAQSGSGLYLGTKSLVGPGIFQMKPKTSTKTPPTAAGSTNPIYLVWADGATNPEYGNFSVVGTDQGHLYNGMMIGHATGVKLHDVSISGIPGNSSGPPGETFSLNLWHVGDSSLSKVVLDGRQNGAAVAATLLGYNYTTGTITVDGLTANYAQYGFAVACFQCTGKQVFNNCDFRFCRKAINLEQTIGGSYEFNNCDFRNLTVAYGAQVSCLNTSSSIIFRDPVVDKYPFQVRTFPGSSPGNVQKESDIRCFINGVDVTSDPTKFVITHAG